MLVLPEQRGEGCGGQGERGVQQGGDGGVDGVADLGEIYMVRQGMGS